MLLPNGYVCEPHQNLIAGVERDMFEADLGQGAGSELRDKFKAPHSSAALAVNSFAPFKRCPHLLQLAAHTRFTTLHFERKCPTGLRGTPPHLDVLCDGADGIVAVESKCTEHLSATVAQFAPAYRQLGRDGHRAAAWFREMEHVEREPQRYRLVDVAQLIKHAFGLAYCFPERPVTLLYLYWEPTNARAIELFARHRDEVHRLARAVAGASPGFQALSYSELWASWDELAEPPWLAEHLLALRQRYAVDI